MGGFRTSVGWHAPSMSSTDQRRATSNASPNPAVRVVIIEDLRDVRESLTVLINGTNGFQCSGSYRTMEDALRGVEGNRPDVILTDIGLPGMDGIEGTQDPARALSARAHCRLERVRRRR